MAENEMTFDAVTRNFEILGEAAKHVPEHLRRHYTDVPWQKIIDVRNRITHDYAETSAPFIWNTIHGRLPALERALHAMLREVDT
ncbi:MAG TPA: HepT-like ribonuclease domain-containing protein [Clostridia bacterium]|nr:HepT-like ribonuclease domain-containing protein [Clostridia bacterium]